MKVVMVRLFAVFREQAGVSRLKIETEAETIEDLYLELRAQYGFTLPTTLVRAAVDEEFVSMHSSIEDGAEVVFIPPVAGG